MENKMWEVFYTKNGETRSIHKSFESMPTFDEAAMHIKDDVLPSNYPLLKIGDGEPKRSQIQLQFYGIEVTGVKLVQ